jgi:energy-coupling factor transport system ATP-binding protein
MIRIDKLTYRYPGAEKDALQISALHIPAGKFCLVIGESGSGKSTLLRLINGLVPHFTGGTLGGQINVAGLDPVVSGPQVMSRQVGFVFQEVENQFVVDIVEDEIAFSMEQAAIPRSEMQARIKQILQKLNLEHLKTRKVDSLSGGETQRIAIAAALVLEPKILVLDEPTSQLDPLAAEEVLILLKQLQQELGLTIVMSEQRLDRVLAYADMVAILSPDGQLREVGLPQVVIQKCVLKPPIVQLAEKRGWFPLPLDVEQARKFTRDEKFDPLEKAQFEIATQTLIEVQHVHVSLGKRVVLKDIDFSLHAQERLVIMGPNGAGKSTLLRTLLGLIAPNQGKILFKGKKIEFQHTAELSHNIGYLPQDPNALLFSETVQQELETTLRNHQIPVQTERIEHLLTQLSIQTKANAYPRDLSTGEKQRVALGAVVVTQPEIIILDEPTRGLDQLTKNALLELLLEWNQNGKTILLVTHEVEFAAAFASRILILEDGQIVSQGDPRKIMRTHPRYTPQIARLYPETNWLTLNDLPS